MRTGDLLRQAREGRALSQRELAQRAGTSQPVVARAEAPGSNPSARTVERLLAAAGAQLALEAVADPHDLSLLEGTAQLDAEARIDRLLTVLALSRDLLSAMSR